MTRTRNIRFLRFYSYRGHGLLKKFCTPLLLFIIHTAHRLLYEGKFISINLKSANDTLIDLPVNCDEQHRIDGNQAHRVVQGQPQVAQHRSQIPVPKYNIKREKR